MARGWVRQVLIAIDQVGNALAGGWADETLSSRAWRAEKSGRRWGGFVRTIIDRMFFFEKNHCRQAFESERRRRQMPPELRR